MPSINMLQYCGQAVQRARIERRITQSFIPFPFFCTHFVRNVWVNILLFTRFIPGSFPRILSVLPPVNQYLYSLPTGLTISTTFLNKNSFNNKNEVRSCV
jgi:hypothetical protein